MKTLNVKNLTTAGILAALVFLLTYAIKIPTFTQGYIHIGDSLVFFAALIAGPVYGFLAAGIGAFLSDILSGYAVYAMPTFFIKGIMTLAVYFIYPRLNKGVSKFFNIFLASLIASCFMVFGYFICDLALYKVGAAISNVPFNIIQGLASSLISIVLLVPVEMIRQHTGIDTKTL